MSIKKHKKAIEWLNTMKACWSGYEAEEAMRIAISAVEHLEKHKATCEWIPCSERLPEEDGFYQVTVQIKETGECYVEKKYYKIKKGWDSYLLQEFIDVIAWMPLPEPYKLKEMRE